MGFLLQVRGGWVGHSLLPRAPDKASQEVRVQVEPLSTVIYWAAESATLVQNNPLMAYAKNENAGVAIADDSGIAILKIRDPEVAKEFTIDAHVYHRVCKGFGMFGRVKVTSI